MHPKRSKKRVKAKARWVAAASSMTVFFTADTHFGDHRVLNISKRPFSSVDEMDGTIMAGWNTVIEPEDEVWHLGDFARTAKIAAGRQQIENDRRQLEIYGR
jgi:calcineurin-like phosphoesterase family protein